MTVTHDAPPSRLSQRLAWARETLELNETASLAAIRARMLRLVTDEDFVPAEACLQALRTLQADAAGAAELDDPPAFARDHERELEAEIETFTAGMFRLPVAQRQARWQRLHAQTEDAIRARARLEQIQAGLAVDLSPLNTESEALQRLGRQVCELFVLLPLARITRREEILAKAGENGGPGEIAARELQSSHPEIAALDAELFRRMQSPPDTSPPLALMKFQDKSRAARWQASDRFFQLLWILPLLVLGGGIGLMLSAVDDRERIHHRTSDPDIFKKPSEEDMRMLREFMQQLQERRAKPKPADGLGPSVPAPPPVPLEYEPPVYPPDKPAEPSGPSP